jgi:hypothetical protein
MYPHIVMLKCAGPTLYRPGIEPMIHPARPLCLPPPPGVPLRSAVVSAGVLCYLYSTSLALAVL